MEIETTASYNLAGGKVDISVSTKKLEKEIVERFPLASTEKLKQIFISESATFLKICDSCPLRRRRKEEKRGWLFRRKISWEGVCEGLERSDFTANYIYASWDKSEVNKLSPEEIKEKQGEANCKPDISGLN